jgi:iron complex outermembrane recepter protein
VPLPFHHRFTPPTAALVLAAALAPPVTHGQSSSRTAGVEGVETILVTERALQTELAATPGGITLVDGDDLRERNVSSLADLLRYVPGVWSVSDSGSDDIFFSSRGSNLDATDYDMNGIKLLQDGLPVTTADGNNHNRVVDPLSARFATVARGANALKYGASTLGGAIDFVSPTARNSDPVDVLLNTGSHGQLLGRTTLSRVFNDRLDALLTLEGKRYDGYREHNEQHRGGLYANAGWQLTDAVDTRFFVTALSNEQELPGSLTRAEVDADPTQASASALGGDFQLNVDTRRVANKTVWQLSELASLEIGLSWEEQDLFHPIVDKVLVPIGPGGSLVEVFSLLIDTHHRDVGAVARYRQRVGDHDLLFGLNWGRGDVDGGNFRNDGGRPNGLTTLIDNDATSLEIYAMDRWQVSERLLLELAAQTVSAERSVRNTTVATGSVRNPRGDYSTTNPRVGVIYALADGVALFANVSRLYEPPTNFELEDEATGSNDILDAMHGTVAEVGARGMRPLGAASSWRWDVALYHARIHDEILSVDDPGAPGTSLSANVDETIHAGVEATLGAEIALRSGGSLEPLLTVTLNDFAFDGHAAYGDNELPAAPGYIVRAELLWRQPRGFYVGPTFDFVGHRFADFASTYRIDSYSLLGLRAGWSNDRFRAYAELRNLLDEDYIASHGVRNLATPNAQILNPGDSTSAYVGVEAHF